MTDSKPAPAEGEYGLEYQIYVLRQMVNQLPKDINVVINGQIDVIVESIKQRQRIIQTILPQLEDIMLNVQYLEFDRNATAQERDAAIKRYKDKCDSEDL